MADPDASPELSSTNQQIFDTMLGMGLTPDDIRLLHQLIEYSQTDYFYPEKNYEAWRDRVLREGKDLAARMNALFPSSKEIKMSSQVPSPEQMPPLNFLQTSDGNRVWCVRCDGWKCTEGEDDPCPPDTPEGACPIQEGNEAKWGSVTPGDVQKAIDAAWQAHSDLDDAGVVAANTADAANAEVLERIRAVSGRESQTRRAVGSEPTDDRSPKSFCCPAPTRERRRPRWSSGRIKERRQLTGWQIVEAWEANAARGASGPAGPLVLSRVFYGERTVKRSGKWAVVRKEAPKMPWESDPTAEIFPRLAQQLGTSFALRHWNLFEQYVAILDDYPDDDDAEYHIREFLENVAGEQGEDVYVEFILVLKRVRLIGGGMERRRIARAALKKQLRRVRRA